MFLKGGFSRATTSPQLLISDYTVNSVDFSFAARVRGYQCTGRSAQ
jgi:hypothetical protein